MSDKPVADPEENSTLTDLELMLELLVAFNVEYTMIQDEAGTTIEVAGGDRGTRGFRGLAITYNFAPGCVDKDVDEKFLFIGMVRL